MNRIQFTKTKQIFTKESKRCRVVNIDTRTGTWKLERESPGIPANKNLRNLASATESQKTRL